VYVGCGLLMANKEKTMKTKEELEAARIEVQAKIDRLALSLEEAFKLWETVQDEVSDYKYDCYDAKEYDLNLDLDKLESRGYDCGWRVSSLEC
jgi:hypothetical protein